MLFNVNLYLDTVINSIPKNISNNIVNIVELIERMLIALIIRILKSINHYYHRTTNNINA